jgi:hypothetical protein
VGVPTPTEAAYSQLRPHRLPVARAMRDARAQDWRDGRG